MDSCMNEKCHSKLTELLKVNALWKEDYEKLLKENKQLKARLILKEESEPTVIDNFQFIECNFSEKPNSPMTSKHDFQFIDSTSKECKSPTSSTEVKVLSYKTWYQKEKANRQKVEEREENLKCQLKECNEIIELFQNRLLTLEKRLAGKAKSALSCCGICKHNIEEERQKNIDLMRHDTFSWSKYPDERDSNDQQNPKRRKQEYAAATTTTTTLEYRSTNPKGKDSD